MANFAQFLIIFISLYAFNTNILPFTSVKFVADDIYITTKNDRSDWMKLKSISNLTSERLIKFSKEHFKENNCEIECYKFEIINL